MAFVFSEPRWVQNIIQTSPGPGSHSPDLLCQKVKVINEQHKKIKKGRAHPKIQKKEQFKQNIKNYSLQKNIDTNHNKFKNKTISSLTKQKLSKIKNHIFEELYSSRKKEQENMENKIMIIKGIHSQNFQSNNKQNSLEQLKIQNSNIQESILIRKTDASIKPVTQQKFYIGSKDQCQKRSIKNTKTSSSVNIGEQKRLKFESKKQFKIKNIKNMEQYFDDNILGKQKTNFQQIEKKVKPISAKHPFSKNLDLYQSQFSKLQQNSTGIQDQQDSQFLPDAVPGPGSYQLGLVQTTKKGMMFTQKNRSRFLDQQKNNYFASQLIYNYKPHTCKSKSRAKQQRVGFGTGVRNCVTKISNNQATFNQFYNDYRSIQNRCLKAKLKDALSLGFFTSKVQRFAYTLPKYQQKAQINETINQQMDKIKNSFQNSKLTYPFSSNVLRENKNKPPTADIDYQGQCYKTIQQTMQNILNQPKYYQNKQNYGPFGQQSEYTEIDSKKRIKTGIQIKHHLIQDFNGFRQRQKKGSKKQIKAYTFKQISKEQSQKIVTPSPTQYHKQNQWVKNSYNIKFINEQKQKQLYKIQNRKIDNKVNKKKEENIDNQFQFLRI